ncbi:hypothetical protein GLYMA_08G266550v4 [Glycine max]|nr:hypothetical protein GLYMA_08G266550v4 [Glycine max]KAH1053249.1 hypothetical protein GYH30_022499 [Glycine max]
MYHFLSFFYLNLFFLFSIFYLVTSTNSFNDSATSFIEEIIPSFFPLLLGRMLFLWRNLIPLSQNSHYELLPLHLFLCS